MRRITALLLAALLLGACLTLIWALPRGGGPLRFAQARLLSLQLPARTLASALHSLVSVLTPAAHAQDQEVLEFEPLPPESVSRLERRRTTAPRPPRPPEVEEVPEPTPPEKPSEIVLGKTGDIMRIGSDIHVEEGQVVGGDLVAMGGDVTIDGHVEGDVVALGGDVQLNATARVDGDVACMGGALTEEPGAIVGGQRVTASGAKAFGKWRDSRIPVEKVRHRVERSAGHVVSSMIWLLIMLGVAWAFAQFAPGRTAAAVATLKRETALSIGIGALIWALVVPSLIALALVVAILCITIIGIPIALAALFGYGLFLGLLWVWGYVVAVTAVGQWVLGRRRGAGIPGDPGAPMAASAEPTLARKALVGVLVVSGIGFAGEVMQSIFFISPLHGLGTLVSVVSTVAAGLAVTIGAGAWLRNEIVSGTLRRWWGGRRSTAQAPAAAAPGVAPEPVVPPPPQV